MKPVLDDHLPETELIDEINALNFTSIGKTEVRNGLEELKDFLINYLINPTVYPLQILTPQGFSAIITSFCIVRRMRTKGSVPPHWEPALLRMDAIVHRFELTPRFKTIALGLRFRDPKTNNYLPLRFGRPVL